MSALESTPLLNNSSSSQSDSPTLESPVLNDQKEQGGADLFWLVMVIWSGVIVTSMDITIIPTLVTPIGSYFDASHQASYIGTSYLLSVCCFAPLYGRLADVLGRKGALLLALGLSGVGTMLCGLSPSMTTLIAARVVSGMGGGGIMPVASVAISDIVPLKYRGLYDALSNLFFGFGSALGTLGGVVNDRMGWRWAFFAQMPVIIASFLMVLNANIPSPTKRATLSETLGRIDWLGSFLFVASVGSFLVAITLKTAEELPWSSPGVWALLLASLLSGGGFFFVEAFISAEPILLLRLLKRRTPISISVATFAISILGFSAVYSIPLYFSTVRLKSASEAGAHLLPSSAAIVVGSFLSGWLIKIIGKYWMLSIVSAGVLLLANLLFASWNDNTSSFRLWFDVLPFGCGMASLYETTMIALVSDVSHTGMPVAVGLYFFFHNTGQAFGVSTSSAITQGILQSQLRDRIHVPNAEKVIRDIRHSTSIIPTLEPELRDAAVASWAISLRSVFIFNALLAIVAIVACITIAEHELPSTVSEGAKAPPISSIAEGDSVSTEA